MFCDLPNSKQQVSNGSTLDGMSVHWILLLAPNLQSSVIGRFQYSALFVRYF